jgi:hypothetical protein
MLRKGDVFWLRGDGEEKDHLHILVSDPSLSPDLVLVPITTVYDDRHHACILSKGDHPRINRESYVDYRLAKMFTVLELESKLSSQAIKQVDPLGEEHLRRVWKGAESDANYIPRGCRTILFNQGLLG